MLRPRALTSVLAVHINLCYSKYKDDLVPLADFKKLPEDLFAVPEPNGDIFLRYSSGEEAQFDVIGVVVGKCLEPPPGYSK